MAKNVSTQDLQSVLSGIEFPANKQAIINQAKSKNASNDIIAALNGIPDRDYTDMEDLMKEVESR